MQIKEPLDVVHEIVKYDTSKASDKILYKGVSKANHETAELSLT